MTPPMDTAPHGYVDRVIVGTAAGVADTVRSMVERGRLVSMAVPHPVPGGKVAVKVRMVAPASGRTNRHAAAGASTIRRVDPRGGFRPVRRRVGVVAAVAAGGLVLVVALGYAAYLFIAAMWPLLLAVAVVLFWLRRMLRRAGY